MLELLCSEIGFGYWRLELSPIWIDVRLIDWAGELARLFLAGLLVTLFIDRGVQDAGLGFGVGGLDACDSNTSGTLPGTERSWKDAGRLLVSWDSVLAQYAFTFTDGEKVLQSSA